MKNTYICKIYSYDVIRKKQGAFFLLVTAKTINGKCDIEFEVKISRLKTFLAFFQTSHTNGLLKKEFEIRVKKSDFDSDNATVDTDRIYHKKKEFVLW